MWRFVPALVVLASAMGCGAGPGETPLSPHDKQQICNGAIEGAREHCLRLGIPEDPCNEIASEAFRVCFESAPGG